MELTRRMPRARVLTESDGPFARIGGRSIFPWDVDVAVDALAQCWGSDPVSVETFIATRIGPFWCPVRRLGPNLRPGVEAAIALAWPTSTSS